MKKVKLFIALFSTYFTLVGCSTTSMVHTEKCIEQVDKVETNSAEVANARLQHCLDESYQARRAERSAPGALFGDLMVAILQRAFSNRN
ncbi:DNA ligase [Alteromonas sp. S015]|uniref:DNA ligase n=1 Tax=Alteromonas sp. S015 TaxID=3117401 RepID=UPI002FE08A47